MDNKNTPLVILLILIILLAVVGIILGVMFYKNKGVDNGAKKQMETFNLTLDDMYSNIKDSKKIAKLKVTVSINNESTYNTLSEKQFLIRDDINKIIRNKTEEELQGEEGQTKLQNEIKGSLIELFNDETITNVYFDDFIIQ
jgi:flagellar FliL protein